MKPYNKVLILTLLIFISVYSASAPVIDLMSFEASLFNSSGDPINGNIIIGIYDAETGGNLINNSLDNLVNSTKKQELKYE